jgi:hypothetical protein
MKNYYAWEIHDKYARYWTKESIESPEEFDELFDIAEKYFLPTINPNDLKVWNPPIIKEEMEKGRPLRQGDSHSSWMGGCIVSQNMVDKIGNILKKYGELFPFEVEDREDKLYRYWVTNEISFSKVDKKKSKFFDNNYSDNNVFKIEKLVFLEDAETNDMIFRITEEYEKTIFVTSEFIDIVKDNNLKGFNFILDSSYDSKDKIVKI